MASEDVFAAFLGEVKELSEKAEAKKDKEKSTNEGEANAAGPDPSGQPSPSAQRTCAPTIQAGPRVVKSRAAVTNTGKQNDAQRNSDTLDPIQSMMNRDFQKRQKVQAARTRKVDSTGPSSTPTFGAPTIATAQGSAITSHQMYQNDRVEASGKMFVRQIGGEKWVDPTLAEWPENDFRLFVGDLGSEVDDAMLSDAFKHFASFNKAKVIREKRTNKSKGFGFVSFADGIDFARALREMNGKHIGNRPCKLKKSEWKQRGATQSRAYGPKGVVKTKYKRNKKHLNF